MEVVRQHRALRGALRELGSLLESDRASFHLYMGSLVEFLLKVHARLEDEQLFPALLKACRGTDYSSFERMLGRLTADHRLLETLGKTIASRGRGFDQHLLRERFEQFGKILLEHNASEEKLYAEINARCGGEGVRGALETIDPQKIIEEFGRERYLEFMRLAD